MKAQILLAGAMTLALSASEARAQSTAEQIVAGLQEQGFTRIEVDEGPTQIKVEAIRGDTKLEYIYDKSTGEILSQEVEPVEADEDRSPGVEIDREEGDFLDSPDRGGSEESSGDDGSGGDDGSDGAGESEGGDDGPRDGDGDRGGSDRGEASGEEGSGGEG